MPRTSLHIDQDLLQNLDDCRDNYIDEFNLDYTDRGRGQVVNALLRHAIRNLPSTLQRERDEAEQAAAADREAPVLVPYNPPREILKETPEFVDTLDAGLSRKHIVDMDVDDLLNLVLVEENVTRAAETDLRRLAEKAPATLAKMFNIPIWTANRLALIFEFGKRLACSHSDKVKITNQTDVADYLMPKMRYLQKEVVVTLCMDTKSQITDQMIIAEKDTCIGKLTGTAFIFEGTLNASVFHPREIFRYAIENAANSIILAHNHPSGDPQPSQEDIRATKQLIEAGNQIGIKVLDHLVIGDGIFVSMKEENII